MDGSQSTLVWKPIPYWCKRSTVNVNLFVTNRMLINTLVISLFPSTHFIFLTFLSNNIIMQFVVYSCFLVAPFLLRFMLSSWKTKTSSTMWYVTYGSTFTISVYVYYLKSELFYRFMTEPGWFLLLRCSTSTRYFS